MDRRVSTVPARRMKMKRDHRVPLSRRAVEIVDAAREIGDAGNPVMFANDRRKRMD